jgi:peptidoglycan/xylan/chitin deacetylase (PgdA/CDA1 family)
MLRILALSLAVVGVSCAQTDQGAAGSSPAPVAPASPVASGAAAAAQPAAAPAAKADPRITISQCHVEGLYAAITFDDGPHGTQTPRLLKMLRDRGIHSTFFLVGQCVAENPEVARQIVAEGHEVANHSWNHPLLSKMAEGSVRDQIQRTRDVVLQETGVNMTLFRPPFGGFTTNQRAWAHATWGYQIILWDVDSLDWKHRSPAKTQAIILSDARPGSIILCHDIHKTTVDAMPATLDALIAKGFKLVTVSELLKMHREPATSVRRPSATVKSLTPAEAANAASSLTDAQKENKNTTAKP